ncbi:MAG: PilZ domain-containing protein [Candidatus Omnitrophica bacterium]|nr:PilZ domain-containing protein [Candidatus Omnitrophota bacterium]
MNDINQLQEIERRKFVRIPQNYILRFAPLNPEDFTGSGLEQQILGVVKNLSVGGALFESRVPLSTGTLLKVEIELPGWEKFKSEFYKNDKTTQSSPLVALATVVRVEVIVPNDKFDIGVVFSAVDQGHKWALMQYVESYFNG